MGSELKLYLLTSYDTLLKTRFDMLDMISGIDLLIWILNSEGIYSSKGFNKPLY
jgi:hypothetical protein